MFKMFLMVNTLHNVYSREYRSSSDLMMIIIV